MRVQESKDMILMSLAKGKKNATGKVLLPKLSFQNHLDAGNDSMKAEYALETLDYKKMVLKMQWCVLLKLILQIHLFLIQR